jgi:hypothetical protein
MSCKNHYVSNTYILYLSTCSGWKISKAQSCVTLLLLQYRWPTNKWAIPHTHTHTHTCSISLYYYPGKHTTECNHWCTLPLSHHHITHAVLQCFFYGPGTQAKCIMHPQMPSAASHPPTIPPGSCTVYLTLPSISNKHLKVFFMISPLSRCISALFLLLEINRQCTPQKNVSLSPAIIWKIEVHLSFVVIDIYAEDKECNTHSCMTHIKQTTYEC